MSLSEGEEIDVEFASEPVPVSAAEREYIREPFVESMRRNSPDFSWDGAGMPEFKQRYNVMVADQAGRIWISREGPSVQNDPCTRPRDAEPGVAPIPCWETTRILEAFNLDGEYLGRLERPAGISFFGPHFTEDRMFAAIQHPDGIPMVKAFRIVFPTDS